MDEDHRGFDTLQQPWLGLTKLAAVLEDAGPYLPDPASNFDKGIDIVCRLVTKRRDDLHVRTVLCEGTVSVGEKDAFNRNVVMNSRLIAEGLKDGACVPE